MGVPASCHKLGSAAKSFGVFRAIQALAFALTVSIVEDFCLGFLRESHLCAPFSRGLRDRLYIKQGN